MKCGRKQNYIIAIQKATGVIAEVINDTVEKLIKKQSCLRLVNKDPRMNNEGRIVKKKKGGDKNFVQFKSLCGKDNQNIHLIFFND